MTYFFAGICLLLITLTNPGCNGCCCSKDCKQPHAIYRNTDSGFKPNDSQILVFHTATTNEYVNQWLDSIGGKYGDISVYLGCRACSDSSLLILDGAGVKAWVQTGTAPPGGSGKDKGPSGGDTTSDGRDTMYYCRNLTILVPELNQDSPLIVPPSYIPLTPVWSTTTGTTMVGVLDTGIDTALLPKFKRFSSPASCPEPDAVSGWNFSYNSKDVTDDYRAKHGTVVTRFILDQVGNLKNNDVSILPVKVFDSTGATNLSVILCGLSYAKDRGAQIINASFGFYARRTTSAVDGIDSGGLLLEKYVEKYLTANHILLIAAAGNTEGYEREVFIPNPDNAATLRNLDSVSFYPASLSRRLSNVITVTTTYADSTGQVTPNQNFSPNVVGIGVVADQFLNGMPGSDCVFLNPIVNKFANGSSFAAPIATGNIAAFYQLLPASGGNNYDGVVGALLKSGQLRIPPPLINPAGTAITPLGATMVKKGAYIRK